MPYLSFRNLKAVHITPVMTPASIIRSSLRSAARMRPGDNPFPGDTRRSADRKAPPIHLAISAICLSSSDLE